MDPRQYAGELGRLAGGHAGDTFTRLGSVGRFFEENSPAIVFSSLEGIARRRTYRALARVSLYERGVTEPTLKQLKESYSFTMFDPYRFTNQKK